jgi:hypothetical protein
MNTMMSFAFATTTVVAASSALSGSVAVAIGALVVVLAIVLVFFMVLRSNGGARKTASGIGYDAQRGPLGQPGGDGAWRQGQAGQQGWQQPDEYAAGGPGVRGGGAWGQTQDYPGGVGASNPMSQGQPGGWGAPQGPAGNWEESAAASGGGWGAAGGAGVDAGAAGEQWPPRQPGGWGAPAQGQASRPMGGANGGAGGWGDTPAATPSGGSWDAAPQGPAAGGRWGAPAGNQPAGQWGQPEANAPGWGAPATPPAPGDWGQSGGGASGARGGWGADAAPAGPAAGGWSGPAGESAPQGSFGGFGDVEKTRIANPAAVRGTSMIVVRQGREPGRIFEMRKDRMTIGRSRESDIFLEDLAVSRLHTTISRDGQGQYVIRDESSANGTYVNGQKITEQVLAEGDEIQVGQTVLGFVKR